MRQKQSSTTAEGMALVRAIEASRPEGKRICYDPIARSMVPGYKFFLSKLIIDSACTDDSSLEQSSSSSHEKDTSRISSRRA
ncbi:hypothetical protein [Methanosarcina horonobensis]|uniref:hypothetical protein n=1 Tax=Methanosarcina horonobensis TaxID=418008 RepID=UPI000A67F88D|nr:hypothetical protein [Methanosarcina horonobensis]